MAEEIDQIMNDYYERDGEVSNRLFEEMLGFLFERGASCHGFTASTPLDRQAD